MTATLLLVAAALLVGLGGLMAALDAALGVTGRSDLIDSAATNQPLTAEIRGTAIALHRVQPPFIPLKKSP